MPVTCIHCREYGTESDNVLCARCLAAEYAQALHAAREAAAANLPPSLCFLINVAVEDVGMTGPRATGLQRAMATPEPAIPAAFAHLVENSK